MAAVSKPDAAISSADINGEEPPMALLGPSSWPFTATSSRPALTVPTKLAFAGLISGATAAQSSKVTLNRTPVSTSGSPARAVRGAATRTASTTATPIAIERLARLTTMSGIPLVDSATIVVVAGGTMVAASTDSFGLVGGQAVIESSASRLSS
ncbi:hypothetical protein [Amycolatopsis sp. CA-230715]|uniref:hypothetical protein n=1 Tax=Amycolatopsis sp. CA-230715 TaxID=2745196 RepID=UPI001C027E42|nr:hypothetical protein [Amycolatopsis sp. CA-230715]